MHLNSCYWISIPYYALPPGPFLMFVSYWISLLILLILWPPQTPTQYSKQCKYPTTACELHYPFTVCVTQTLCYWADLVRHSPWQTVVSHLVFQPPHPSTLFHSTDYSLWNVNSTKWCVYCNLQIHLFFSPASFTILLHLQTCHIPDIPPVLIFMLLP